MKTTRMAPRSLVVAGCVAMLGLASACNDGGDPRPSVDLRVQSVQAKAGGDSGTWASSLESDVLTRGRPLRDLGRLILTATSFSPSPEVLTGHWNDVTLEKCEVRFWREDGHNVEGQDVPPGHVQSLDVRVPADAPGSTDIVFVLVPRAAKEEPPLADLSGAGQRLVEAVAELAVHGRTTAGEAIVATARIPVRFADFAD